MSEYRRRLVSPPASPSAHLSDPELASSDRSGGADKHLADCMWCRSRLASFDADEGARHELAALLGELAGVAVPQSALDAAAAWSVPQHLASLLEADEALAPAVSAGQLWRLSWNGEQALAVVVNHKHWLTRVAPLTTDVVTADEYALLVSSSDSSLDQDAVVFTRAAATVPTFTLAQFLGDVTVGGAPSGEFLKVLDSACLLGSNPADALPTGAPLRVDDWESQELLDSLQGQMEWFAASVMDVDGHDAPGNGDAAESVSVQGLLATASREKQSLADIAALTGLEMSRVLNLMNGRATPTPAEVASIGDAFGQPAVSGLSPEDRNALLEVVSDPTLRPFRAKFNQSNQPSSDPSSVAPLLARLLNDGLAARSSSGSDEAGSREKWRARIAFLQQQS
jgi:transcriptional regulator with XRE-family HTH domain